MHQNQRGDKDVISQAMWVVELQKMLDDARFKIVPPLNAERNHEFFVKIAYASDSERRGPDETFEVNRMGSDTVTIDFGRECHLLKIRQCISAMLPRNCGNVIARHRVGKVPLMEMRG